MAARAAGIYLIAVVALATALLGQQVQRSHTLFTVGTLPTCGADRTGYIYSVTDADSSLALGAGGGSVMALAQCNGTTWASITTESAIEALVDLQDLQGAVTDGQVPDTITASNYVLKAGDTMTGTLGIAPVSGAAMEIGSGSMRAQILQASGGTLSIRQSAASPTQGLTLASGEATVVSTTATTRGTSFSLFNLAAGGQSYSLGSSGLSPFPLLLRNDSTATTIMSVLPSGAISIPVSLAASGAGTVTATTATALAANGANCSAGNYPLGVDASGAVETCTADDDTPDAGDFGALALTGPVTSVGLATSITNDSIALGTKTTGGYAASVSEAGPATTATALAADGANCSAGQYPLGVDAAGAVQACTVDDDVPEVGDFTNLTATAPITISTGVIASTAASASVAGHVTTGTQFFGGFKILEAAGSPLGVNSTDSSVFKITLYDAGSVAGYLGAKLSSGYAFQVGSTASVPLLTVANAGGVGIGSLAPDNLLDVHSETAESAIAITSLGTDTDALIKFELANNTPNFVVGVDDSVSGDPFVLSRGTALGTNNMITANSAGSLVLSQPLGLGTETNAIVGTVSVRGLDSEGSDVSVRVVGPGAGAGDAYLAFGINSTTPSYSVGYDNSVAGDPFVISSGKPGTANALSTDGVTTTLSGTDTYVTGSNQTKIYSTAVTPVVDVGNATGDTLSVNDLLFITPRTSPPTASDGTIYHDNSGALCFKTGGAWSKLAGAGTCA